MLDGVLDLSFLGLVVATLVFTHITIASVTIYLHRAQAHRALELHPVTSHFFRLWLWLSTGMITREWVAIHRKHHAKCETSADPHSPQVLGIRKVLWEGSELYREEAAKSETLERYGHGVPDDWLERNVYCNANVGVTVMLLINLMLFGLPGISIWGIQMLWIPIWAAGVINGVGHYWGYRSYETSDASANIVPWGVFIGGEELHNNHHAFPSSARLSSKWWEFDLGWFYIRLMQVLRLARVKKVAPRPRCVPGKRTVDLDTLRAVVVNRLHIMAYFARHVVVPVVREELERVDRSGRRLLKRSRLLLMREEERMNDQDRARLDGILQLSHALRTVHEYRRSLQDLWNRTTVGHEKLLSALQDWCVQAEASGIKVLEDFAAYLRSYTLNHA